METIVFDTETTALLAPSASGQENQPHLIELFAVRLTIDLQPIAELHVLCNPRVPIPEQASKINGFTDEGVAQFKPFAAHWRRIAEFWKGTETCVGHNVLFDKSVLYWELFRLGKSTNFPWCINDICTVEAAQKWLGHRISLTDLYIKLFDTGFDAAHSARNDTLATVECYRKLIELGVIRR